VTGLWPHEASKPVRTGALLESFAELLTVGREALAQFTTTVTFVGLVTMS